MARWAWLGASALFAFSRPCIAHGDLFSHNGATAAALDDDDECGGPAVSSDKGPACAASALQLRSEARRLPNSVHFDHRRPHSREVLANGVEVARWSSRHAHDGRGLMPAEITDRPPHVTMIVLKPGQRFPAQLGRLTTPQDVMYVVTKGSVRCELCRGAEHDFEAGDVFFTTAHRLHGPFVNRASGEAIVKVASIQAYTYDVGESEKRMSDHAFTQHVLRYPRPESKGLAGWGPSGIPKRFVTEECWNSGAVKVRNFGEQLNMPNVMNVQMGRDCFIPCHEHPSGALYFVLRGTLHVKGDMGLGNSTFVAGDVRWARPNFIYGPEFSGRDGMAQMVVLGLPGSMTAGMCKR